MNDVHDSGVLGWIKQSNVPFPHSQAWKPSVCCSFSEDLAGIFVPFHSDNWGVSKDFVGKEATSMSCE
jgi:hypothetical protein